MGTQITRLTRLAAAGLSAVLLFATAACAATSPAETEPDNKTSVPAPTGPINVVASLNQWGSLAAELGGDDVEVTSIVNSTNVDAHDFEPKTSDVAKLSKAQIIVANGAGYDSWATKSMTKTTNIVSAASVMGAMEGDNPHLWFSKDARSSMATAITDAYVKALPSKKKAFQKRLKAWQADEKSLETWASEFTRSHSDLTYAATEPVVYYLMADLGFKNQTPKGYTQSTASGGEPAPADLQSFQKLIEDKGVDVLVNNTQEASDATNMITGAAGRADVPVVDVSEQMPKDTDTLNAWINQLINTIIDAVDPSYGCEDATDGTDDISGGAKTNGDTTDGNANSDDSSADGAATDDANAQDSKASTGSSTEPKYIRQCKAATSSDSSQDSAKADASNGDSGDASGNDQTDSGK